MDNNYDNYYYIEGYYNNIPSYRWKHTINKQKETYNYIGKMKTGIKWECIEFIRRYFIKKYHLIFMSLKNVYDMLNLRFFFNFLNFKSIPLKFFNKYDLSYIPKIDDLVIFKHNDTGHIAIISQVLCNCMVKICEQNWNKKWETNNYSRKISIYNSNIIGFFRIYNK
jgi:hypothetical protein